MYAAPNLPHIDQQCDQLLSSILVPLGDQPSVWRVTGAKGSGKSFLMGRLAKKMADDHAGQLVPIPVAPPIHQIDTGCAALVQIGEGLRKAGLINGEANGLREPERPWENKLDLVRGWLNNHREQIVLMGDDIDQWPPEPYENRRFAGHARDVANLVLYGAQCRRIITGNLPRGVPVNPSVHLNKPGTDLAWLRTGDNWGVLAGDAEKLANQHGDALGSFSPLELRLLVGLSAISGPEVVAGMISPPQRAFMLAKQLDLQIDIRKREWGEFLRFWRILSLVRRPFHEELLTQLGYADLDSRVKALVTSTLLYRPDESFWVMHDVLNKCAGERMRDQQLDLAEEHKAIAAYYRSRFENSTTEENRPLDEEVEAYHHASASGDPDFIADFRCFFGDQLDALGRALSRKRMYPQAVEVFERALRWNDKDDYAHHYRAYNLDMQGIQARDVGASYRRALELDPGNVWWWSRLISFLITRGRIADAQAMWGEALETLDTEKEGEEFLYRHLHRWILRLLLHRGRLDFARNVLNDVPSFLRSDDANFKSMANLLDALVAARERQLVFPLTIPVAEWWNGPHLSAGKAADGSPLQRWLPGRVDGTGEGEVQLTVAMPPETDKEVGFHHLTLSWEQFDRFSLDLASNELAAGRFIEMAYYSDGASAEPIIRVHRDQRWVDNNLPSLYPDPARYHRSQSPA